MSEEMKLLLALITYLGLQAEAKPVGANDSELVTVSEELFTRENFKECEYKVSPSA